MKQKIITVILFMVYSIIKAQISGSLNLNTAPKQSFIGEFSSFNDGMFNAAPSWGININWQGTTQGTCAGANGKVDSRIYAMNDSLQPVLHRFPGGEVSHTYQRYLAYGFENTNNVAHKLCTNTYPSGTGSGKYNKNLLVPNLATYGITQQDANDNTIFPFINKITNNKTDSSRTVYVLNILEHYKKATTINGTTYNTRQEIFDPTKKAIYENISTLAQLNSNPNLSIAFKKAVYNNIDGIMTFINNGVAVPFIELGNEMSVRYTQISPETVTCKIFDNPLALLLNINPTTTTYNNHTHAFENFKQGNSITYYTNNAVEVKPKSCTMPTTTINSSDVENRFWWFDWVPITVNDTTQFSNKSKYTLDCYAALCKMYINIIKNLRPSDGIRFGMYWDDGESSFDSVWRYQNQNHVWCTYLKAKQAYIGFDDFILHPYFTGIHHNSDALSLTGDAFFNTTLINIKTYLQQNIGKDALALPFLSNELPTNSKIWLTEWDILASGASNFNNKIFNTFLDAYYYSEFLFGLIEMNTIGTRKNLYSISNKYLFNNLFSSAVSGSSHFQIAYNASHSTQLTNTSATFKKRILYHTQKILLPIINNTKGYKFVNVPNGGFTNVPTGVKIRVFKKDALGTPAIGENAGELIIYYYNTSGSSQTLNLNTYLSSISQNVISGYSLRYNPTSNKYKFTLWSDKMSASRGKTVLNTSETLSNNASVTIQFRDGYLSGSSGETELLINSSDLDASSNFKINKYEIGYIRVPLIYGASAMRKAKETEENFNLLKGNNFSIYPNPAKDNITLEYAGEINKNAILEIFDMKGELQYQKNIEIQDGINKYNIITNNLSKGTYIIKLKNNTEIKTEKIIIE